MYKIIKHGNKYPIYRFICPFCECKFEANSDEVHIKEILNGYGDFENDYFIKCPECGNGIEIGEQSNLQNYKLVKGKNDL